MRKLTLAAGLLISPVCSAKIMRRPSSPFDFSQSKVAPANKGRGILRTVLHYVDGGGLNGIPQADMTSHKMVDPIATMTVRAKFHF